MHDDWQTFIEAQGARIDDHDLVVFPDAAPLPACALADLSELGLLRVSGADARTFLQGQVTNDVRQVSAEHSQLNSLCSPKGRMLANFRVFEREGDLYLQLPRTGLEAVRKRLQMFVLRSQVTLEDVSDQLVRIGIAGGCAEQLLPEVPAAASGATCHPPPLTIIRLPGDRPRFELIGPADAVIAFWEQSASLARPAGPDFWALMDIRAGLPTVYPETTEAFVPQMVNLQLIDGVSFTKGCYTGQEVVARMQYLGKLKRRMYLARVDSAEAPRPGDALYSPISESGQGAGRVVDARPSPDGGHELLAVIEIAGAEHGGLRLGDPEGPQLTLQPLPYALPEAAEA
jgi:folate-binding protein YgfZ